MKKILLALVLLTSSVSFGQDLKIQYDSENVVATHIGGTWVMDSALNMRLTGEWSPKMAEMTVSFKNDSTILKKVPAELLKYIKDDVIYLAGELSGLGLPEPIPFALINLSGNPHIVMFRKRNSDVYNDTESVNVMMAVGEPTKNDLLFIGGDFNNQPFLGFKRVNK